MANYAVPLFILGAGGLLLYSGFKNENPLGLLGNMFGFTTSTSATGATTVAPSAPASAASLNAAPATLGTVNRQLMYGPVPTVMATPTSAAASLSSPGASG
jgi:hypothetical protein